jgi:two-component system cell cycle sensor histidine kinase/response regulator CckA
VSHQSDDVGILENMLSVTDVLCAYMDRDFNIIRVNRAYAEADGREPEFFVGKNHFDLFPREDKQIIFERVVETGEPHCEKAMAFEYAQRPERGVSYWDWMFHPVKDAEGRVEAVVLCLQSADERIETERKLREAESRLSTAVESLPFDFFVLDAEGRCTFQNAASRKTWGDVTGKQPMDVADDPDTLALWESNNRRVLAGEIVESDVKFRVKGEMQYYHNIIAPMRDGEEIVGIQGMNIDITEREQASDLMRIQRDLAVRLTDTRELDQGLSICLDAALEASGMDCGGICLFDEESGSPRMVSSRGLSPSFVESASSFAPDSPSLQIAKAGKPIYTTYCNVGVPLNDVEIAEDLRAIAVIPMLFEGQVIGCMNVASRIHDEVPLHTRTALEAMVAQISGAVARLKAEEAMRESEERFRALFEYAPDGFYLNDLHGRFLDGNRAAEQITGFRREELIGKSFLDLGLLSAENIEKAAELLARNADGLSTGPDEFVLNRKDGTRVPVEIVTMPVSLGGGKIVLGIARDISKRKEAERALQESQGRYRTLADNMNDIVWTMDLDLNLTSVSSSVERTRGYTPAEFMRLGLSKQLTPESLKIVQEVFREELEEEAREGSDPNRSRKIELEVVAKDGTVGWAENRVTFLRGEDGRPTGIFGIARDITESRRAEEALRKSEASLKAINNAVGMVLHIMILDRDLQVLEHNDKILDGFGPCVGRKCHQAVKGEVTPCKECPVKNAWKDGGVHRLDENWIRPAVGVPVCFKVVAVPMFEPDGSFEKVMVVAEDVTGLKTSEEGRRKAEEELEEQRVLAIASDRLRSLGEMATGIAHELNQPLVGVRGLAEHVVLALDREWEMSKNDVHDKLQKIVEQADRMAYIIEHVRMFAREADRPEMYPVNVNEVVNSSLGLVSAQLRQRGLELECELAEDVPHVKANQYALEEVILNLVTNARDAVEERLEADSDVDPVVALRTCVEKRGDGSWVKVEVIDRGVGITAEQLGRVFDPFYTTKSPDRGTGLGLAISRSIIEKSGGTIEIHSEPGGRTTAVVSLPAIRDE